MQGPASGHSLVFTYINHDHTSISAALCTLQLGAPPLLLETCKLVFQGTLEGSSVSVIVGVALGSLDMPKLVTLALRILQQ